MGAMHGAIAKQERVQGRKRRGRQGWGKVSSVHKKRETETVFWCTELYPISIQ